MAKKIARVWLTVPSGSRVVVEVPAESAKKPVKSTTVGDVVVDVSVGRNT